MSNDIDKAVLIDKFSSFANTIVSCEPDEVGGYTIGVQKANVTVNDQELLQEANIIQTDLDSPESNSLQYFSLQTFELVKIGYKFYATLDELINQNTYGLRHRIGGHTIDNHYVNEYKTSIPNIAFQDTPNDILFDNLFTIYALNDVLQSASDDHTGDNDKTKDYTFFEKKKITVSSQIDPQKVKEVSPSDRKIIFDLFTELKVQNGNDRKIRLVFFKSALEKVCDILKNVDMNFIIGHLAKIESEYHSNYRAYLNSLDPSKLRIDFEKGSQEFVGKLSSTLSDIHGKIILIPLAAIAAIFQISREHPLKNFILAVAVGIIVWIVLKFSDTQKSILAQVKENITDFINLYSSEAKEYSEFTQQINKKSNSMLNLCDEIDTKIDLSQQVGYFSIALVIMSAVWVSCNEQIIAIWCFFTQCTLR